MFSRLKLWLSIGAVIALANAALAQVEDPNVLLEKPRLTHFSGLTELHRGTFSVTLAPSFLSLLTKALRAEVVAAGMSSRLVFDFPPFSGEGGPFIFYDQENRTKRFDQVSGEDQIQAIEYNTIMGQVALTVFRRDSQGQLERIFFDRLSSVRYLDGRDRRAIVEYSVDEGLIFLKEANGYLSKYGDFIPTETSGVIAKVGQDQYRILEAEVSFSFGTGRLPEGFSSQSYRHVFADEGSIAVHAGDPFRMTVQRKSTAKLDGGIFVPIAHLLAEIGGKMKVADFDQIFVMPQANR